MEPRTREYWPRWIWVGFVCWALAGPVSGAEITARLPSGLTAYAEYREGDADKAAVLILHGFMTTQNFNIIRTLTGELHEQGHTVLAPTLTLGIDQRRGGLACESIHTHTMENDLAELGWWAKWLSRRHGGPLAIIGHSSGSLQAIAYAGSRPDVPLAVVVATSPIFFGQDYSADLVRQQMERAGQEIAEGTTRQLHRYALTFCDHNYVSTPQSYLSYARWGREQVLAAVQRAQVPIYAILGGTDPRATASWRDGLRDAGAKLTVLEGGSHFFDGTHEFDLLDYVHSVLHRVAATGAGRGPL